MDADPGVTLKLARVMAPVTVLGPGARIGLWVQGCGLACPGCASRDTWDPAGGQAVPVGVLVEHLGETLRAERMTGLTLTGGEPTDQAAGLTDLVRGLRRQVPDLDVLVFTGRTWAAAQALAPALMSDATAVVAGPYRREQPRSDHRLLSSPNQTLHVKPAATQRYARWVGDTDAPRIQALAEGESLYLVGLPAPGDLEAFRSALAERGVTLEGVSW